MKNDDFNAKIDALWAETKAGNLPRKERFAAIERLVDDYITATGKRPEPAQLDRLASLCLHEELTDSTPWKVRNTERPILSDRQKQEIGKNEVTNNFPNKHRIPTRRKWSNYENIAMDRAKSRDAERMRKYNEFVRTQPVMRWNKNEEAEN